MKEVNVIKNFTIALADKNNENEVVNVLNEVTLNLLEKEINQWEYPWDKNEIKKEIEGKRIFVVFDDNNQIIATFSIKNIDENLWVKNDSKDNLYLYRIAVLPQFQGMYIGEQIAEYVFNIAKTLNKRFYLDCWAGNEKLKKFYSTVGFCYVGDYSEGNYIISVFSYE